MHTMPRKGSGKENIAICLCRSLNSCTRSPAQMKNESFLFITFRLESEAVFSQRDLKKHWKGVHHHASRSDLDAYIESLQNSESLSTALRMESSICLLKLCWQSWEPRLLIHTPKGHTWPPWCYCSHRVITCHTGFAGLDSNTALAWFGFKY